MHLVGGALRSGPKGSFQLWWPLGTQQPQSGLGCVHEKARACLLAAAPSCSDWLPCPFAHPQAPTTARPRGAPGSVAATGACRGPRRRDI